MIEAGGFPSVWGQSRLCNKHLSLISKKEGGGNEERKKAQSELEKPAHLFTGKAKTRQMCISQDCAASWRQNQEIDVWKLTADGSFLSEHIPNCMDSI